MKEIKRDGAFINYNIYGDGDTTLLFVHGSYIDQTYWSSQVEYFSKHYKVVTFDLPGQGLSGKDRKQWSINGFSEDVAAVMQELNLKNVILIGHSMGGDVNLITATSHPENIIGFVVVDIMKNAATPLPPEYQNQVADILENLKKDFAGTNEQYARMALLTAQTPKAITDKIVQAYRNAYQPMGQAITPEIFEMYKTEQKLLSELKFKLYLLNVDYMPANEEPLKNYVQHGYEVFTIKGTSHYPMIENPGEFNQTLDKILQQIALGN